MGDRSVNELPVPILTDEELITEHNRTFLAATTPQSTNGNGNGRRVDEATVRRNAAAMGELVRRGYRSDAPEWSKNGDS